MPSPSVRVSFPMPGPPPVDVTFDFGRIAAIEDALGRSAFDVLEEILGALPVGLEVGKQPTSDQAAETARRLRLGTVTRFLAGCLGVPLADLSARVPAGEMFRTFGLVWPGFAAAVLELLPKPDGGPDAEAPPAEDAARPTSDASVPGASSTSGSGSATSTG